MSRKSELTFMKKGELVNIILRKDNVEKELKEKNEELTSQVQKLTDAQAESNKRNGKLISEVSTLKENIEDVRKKLTEKENELFNAQTNSSRKTIVIICLAVIAILGWII
jgi:uncharacterized coiled-coil DUF342 family protein